MSRIRLGINGFGRIGRMIFRLGWGQPDIEFVGINSLDSEEGMAHLLKYDSAHGIFSAPVSGEKGYLHVGTQRIPVSRFADPAQIPWKQWGADIVLECTGALRDGSQAREHLKSGARFVIISAPADGVDGTFVVGVNHTQWDPEVHKVISNASCTTNALAPLVKVLDEAFGFEKGYMTTIHSYTNDQRLVDAPHKDLRRARAAAVNMIPTTTGAAKAVGLVLPHLKGRIDGVAIRVPTLNVSLVDLTFISRQPLTVESLNGALKSAAQTSLKGILSVCEQPLVSSDFNGNTHSSIVDALSTQILDAHMGKVFAWYDNETGFSQRMLDLSRYMALKAGL